MRSGAKLKGRISLVVPKDCFLQAVPCHGSHRVSNPAHASPFSGQNVMHLVNSP